MERAHGIADNCPKASLSETVKLVIWDLDDTFWRGTLSEEAIVPITDNIELVKTLATRGIVSSICSKNEASAAEHELKRLAVWDYFVLPSISFQSKGNAIAALIDALQLRAANVVFIDDNPSVLAEAGLRCPGLVCLTSPAHLAAQLDHKYLRGTPDQDLIKLKQYQLIARKYNNKQTSSTSDEIFLRQSEINISIDYAIEPHIERIIELVNKSNQLNYTKVRIETAGDKERFLKDLSAFGFKAGIVRVRDKYGDYGIVGFFMTLATLREYKLEHFVFSCRIMNMGVEQYVYNYLNRPAIEIRMPVANQIDAYPQVDWITMGVEAQAIDRLRELKLVLIGGCDMLQLSTYCSMESVEFTNRDERGLIKRLDDPFLILGDPARVRQSELRPLIPACSADEMLELQAAIRTADVAVLSLYRMMEATYFHGSDDLIARFDEDAVKAILSSDRAMWFVRNFTYMDYSHEERNGLIRLSLDRLASSARTGAKIIVLLENTRKLENNPNERFLRTLYNEFIMNECARIDKLHYVDVNSATNIQWLYDDGFHMSRQGYFELAQAVKQIIDN
jgi:FkbH-like protein